MNKASNSSWRLQVTVPDELKLRFERLLAGRKESQCGLEAIALWCDKEEERDVEYHNVG